MNALKFFKTENFNIIQNLYIIDTQDNNQSKLKTSQNC